MNVAQIDRLILAAAVRAGYSPAVVPHLRNELAFHILMNNANARPDRIGLLIEELLPGMGKALAEETKAAGLSLTVSGTTH